ncbi:fluoride efflux transporter CrcB [Sphingobacterium sp. DK4209]|uniref:Fluoride-specific ion channel FluC n=1 Tax=Sphingobacterium zhuxiongii TaxID=2662364 RepID=A0A5Q0Q8X9_9SPHI|nr:MULTISPECIES: fluoride efflux transporter CrcB [unclassified Sphingobacterium]MVZ64546.1 fluoride efflux transporter CrcB [Sphingobacterium sp. DK4209]QGA25876.1 fluoride efflux transporter CrcB [Sphingobacterium sp. dk4302]
MFKEALIIGIGGAVGSILRYSTGHFIAKQFPNTIPTGTLFVNIIGCLIIGLLIGFFDKYQLINNQWKLLLITGFCGGFTTFSSFAAENLNLINNNQVIQALLYIVLSVLLGILAVWAGLAIVKIID